jgi:hypothetical protein
MTIVYLSDILSAVWGRSASDISAFSRLCIRFLVRVWRIKSGLNQAQRCQMDKHRWLTALLPSVAQTIRNIEDNSGLIWR